MGSVTFAIIGAGAGGKAAAAHLSLLGYEVNLFNRSEHRIEPLRRRGGVEVEGELSGFANLSKMTTNVKEAVENADVLMVFVPAYAHKDIAQMCAPYLRNGQAIILNPGRTFGAIEFTNTLKACKSVAAVVVAETQTVLYTCRTTKQESGCNIIAIKKTVPIAAFPACRVSEVMKPLKRIFPQFVVAGNVLETGLNNVGCILHPAPMLLNIGFIEAAGTELKYYHDCITPTVASILEELDKERLRVAEAVGVRGVSARDWLSVAYGSKGSTLHESLHNNGFYRTLGAPSTIQHRYLWEDVPTGLVPIASLGQSLGIPCPVTNQMIDLANLICRTDFRRTGRTLQNIGLGKLGLDEIRRLVECGL